MITPTPTELQAASSGLPAMATRKQLAGYLQCSETHIDNMVKRGAIPRVNIGRTVRFPTARVLAALNGEGAAA